MSPSIPVYIVRLGHEITLVHMTRVPCLGEVVFIDVPDAPNTVTRRWRVVYVQHIPAIHGRAQRDVDAEVHCEAVPVDERPFEANAR